MSLVIRDGRIPVGFAPKEIVLQESATGDPRLVVPRYRLPAGMRPSL